MPSKKCYYGTNHLELYLMVRSYFDFNFASNHLAVQMLTKQEHIDYWVKTANRDWLAALDLLASKNYLQALFWGHLVLEKLVKAHWIKDNLENTPTKTHHLVNLAQKTKLDLTEETLRFFYLMNQFQLEGRYPDYYDELYKKYKYEQTKAILDQIDIERQCLIKKLL